MPNQSVLERSLAAVWHPCTQMKSHEAVPLIPIQKGEGAWLYDFDGNRYLDAVSSWWVNLFGHCNPRINAALRDQLERLEHVILSGFTHEPVVMLSERLSRLAPGRLGHCFYGSDGASATEIALKMSFHYWRNRGRPGKTGFVSLKNGYHGETVGALSVTDVALFKDTYGSLLRQTVQVPTPDWRYAAPGENPQDFACRCADALENHLAKHHEETAALILEPLIQGAAGMGMYHPVYLRRAREICSRYQVHLIADEIAVGFGRTGTLFAWEQGFPASGGGAGPDAEMAPDFLCLSKGITGGYLPLSVVMTHDEIYGAFYDEDVRRGFLHSHSYTGNALACRAALATLDIFEEDDVLARNRAKAQIFTEALAPLAAHPRVKNFRHRGMIWAFEVDGAGADFSKRFHLEAMKRELLLRPIGQTVYFMPPYVISEDEMRLLAERTLDVVASW